jgi:hypothetical protein
MPGQGQNPEYGRPGNPFGSTYNKDALGDILDYISSVHGNHDVTPRSWESIEEQWRGPGLAPDARGQTLGSNWYQLPDHVRDLMRNHPLETSWDSLQQALSQWSGGRSTSGYMWGGNPADLKNMQHVLDDVGNRMSVNSGMGEVLTQLMIQAMMRYGSPEQKSQWSFLQAPEQL